MRLTRVYGKKPVPPAVPETKAETARRLVDMDQTERRALIRMPYLKFMDPAHQRVKV